MDNKNLSGKDIFFGLLIGVAGIYFAATWSSNQASDKITPAIQFVKQEQVDLKDRMPEPSINISAYDYYEAYHANQIAFEKNLLDKPLLITGTVAGIRSGVFDTPYIDIEGSPNAMNKREVTATLRDSQKDLAAKVMKGDVLQMICLGDDVTLGDLYVDDCVIYGISHS